jgi:hypothetical protein
MLLRSVLEDMIAEVDKWTKDYNSYILLARDAAQGHYTELKRIPMVGYVTELVTRVHESVSSLVHHEHIPSFFLWISYIE